MKNASSPRTDCAYNVLNVWSVCVMQDLEKKQQAVKECGETGENGRRTFMCNF